MAINASLRTWLTTRCQSLGSQLLATPNQPYEEGSYFVTKFLEGATTAYNSGGEGELERFQKCIIQTAKVKGLALSSDEDQSLAFRLMELAQRAKDNAKKLLVGLRVPQTLMAAKRYQGSALPDERPPTDEVIPEPRGPLPEGDPLAQDCLNSGGTWDSTGGTCIISGPTAEEICAATGGTWDLATTSCIPAGGGGGGDVRSIGPLDFPRVHREALGYGYWALDLSAPGAEGGVLGVLDAMHVNLYASGCGAGAGECAELAPGPAPDATSSSALVWVTQHRAAGAAIIALVSADGKALFTSTNDVRVASDITNANAAAAVLFEPSGGWGADSSSKTALYVGLGVAGAAVIAGGAWYLTRKKPITPNRRRRRRR
jgi:hypothetical protein